MAFTHEVQNMCRVAQGLQPRARSHPRRKGHWVPVQTDRAIFPGCPHGIGWCAPQQGACKLTLNVKNGIIEEALVETLGCSGMTHSAAMAGGDPAGQDPAGSASTPTWCATPSTRPCASCSCRLSMAARQTAFSEDGLPIGAGLEDLGKGLRSQVGTMYRHQGKRACAIWRWPKAMCLKMALWTKTTRSSAISLSTWAR